MRYFINPHTRMVRTTDDVAGVPPQPWTEVIDKDYDQFRKISKIFLTLSNGKEVRMAGNGDELILKGIKRVAAQAKKAALAIGVEMTTTQALEQTAQLAGYSSYHEAQTKLGGTDG